MPPQHSQGEGTGCGVGEKYFTPHSLQVQQVLTAK
jgi:hypothetical protein